MLSILLLVSVCLPLVVALFMAAWPASNERAIARVAFAASALSALASLGAVVGWMTSGARPFAPIDQRLFSHGTYQFTFALTLDPTAVVFVLLVHYITATVIRFSRFYLHREPGFQRFFAIVLMFQSAMSMLALAGNLQVMFVGWEMVGVASFLLIAFYHERQSAVRNALKTYSVYRVADIGMFLAACLEGRASHAALGPFLLLAAIGKSAQFPFCFWVPRAMEGPTPSSALFYGGLSVHAGAYLLIRTMPLWGEATSIRVAIGVVGLLTAVLCSSFSRVQPTIKAQIGYASITQVGIIFAEISLGLKTLALVHLVSNALLRSYQLLVSPSALAYLLRRQTSANAPRPTETVSTAGSRARRVRATLFAFAINEGYLKELVKAALWSPLRRLGASALKHPKTVIALGASACIAAFVRAPRSATPAAFLLGGGALGAALLFASCALSAWRTPLRAIAWVTGAQVAAIAAVFAIAPQGSTAVTVWATFLAGASCTCGLAGTARVVPRGTSIQRFAGLAGSSRLATAFALAGALGLAGFPLLPTFVVGDLLLHEALEVSLPYSALVAAILALNGYIAVRIFAFTFLGRRERPPVQESARFA